MSVFWLLIYAAAAPLGALVLWTLLVRPGAHKAHVTIFGLVVSILLTSFVTDVVKNAVGRPRPDLLARCKPRADTPKSVLVGFEVCTETDHHRLHDGWRSFPSGHSSFAFSGLGYLALSVTRTSILIFLCGYADSIECSFITGQLHVLRPHANLASVLLALLPLLGAALIAISRCADYRHDVYDVMVGALLGLSIARLVYRKYYPSLASAKCDVPHLARKETGGANGKLPDEEVGGAPYESIPLRARGGRGEE